MRDEGLWSEFASAGALREAVVRLHGLGYTRMDAFTPYPVAAIEPALGGRPKSVTRLAGLAAVVGVVVGYGLQWLLNAFLYPLDVGGRPPHAPPTFVPITFETAVLFAGLTAFVAVLGLSGLPRLWRPAFEIEGFERASIDRFWLHVAADDPRFEWRATRGLLESLDPLRVIANGGPA